MSNKTLSSTMEEFERSSYLSGGNAPYIEALYDQYLENPGAVDVNWQQFFSGVKNGAADVSHFTVRKQMRDQRIHFPLVGTDIKTQEAVDYLIDNYRRFA